MIGIDGPRPRVAAFSPSPLARRGFGALALLAASGRLVAAITVAQAGRLDDLTAYGFTVLFPLVLVGLLLSPPPGRTREGILMRLGTAGHLVLVIAIPPLALQLLLGLPVVFLLVEMFETRLPRSFREPIVNRLVTC